MGSVLECLPRASRVAVIRLRSLGDCVLTTPALDILKRSRPDLRLAVVVEDRFRALFEDNPDLDEILPPHLGVLRRWRPRLCVNFHGGSRSAWMTALCGAEHRAGFGHFRHRWVYNAHIPRAQEILGVERTVHTAEHLASAMFWLGAPVGEIQRARLYVRASAPTPDVPRPHVPTSDVSPSALNVHVNVNVNVGRTPWGVPSGPPDPPVRLPEPPGRPQGRSQQADEGVGVPSGPRPGGLPHQAPHQPPYAVIHPVAATPDKTWRADGFLAVAGRLTEMGLQPIFIGAAADNLTPFAAYPTVSGAPLSQIKTLLSGAALFVGNDSGPAHMAAAFGLPVVVIFGNSNPAIWGPWRTAAEVVSAAGGIGHVTVEQVLDALARLRVPA